MWFGDLVTMRWFDDVWMKEVFANFLAAKIVNPSFPALDHELRFLMSYYPAAYEVDRTAGANPIRQPLDNLRDAGSLYGAIIYQKAPIVMRQLEALVGEAAFRDGLRDYLGRYAFANATWSDLVRILDDRTDEDLADWSRVWVDEPGRPTIRTEIAIEDGRIAQLRFSQTDPLDRGLVWRERLHVVIDDGRSRRTIPVDLNGPAVLVPGAVGLPAPRFVLPTGGGLGYGLFELDAESRRALVAGLPDIPDALTRGAALVTLWDAVLEGQVAPEPFLDLALRLLGTERDELNVQRALATISATFWRLLPDETRRQAAPRVEAALRDGLARASATSLKAAFFAALRDVALTPATVGFLETVWRRQDAVPGLTLSETDESALAAELAVRGVEGSDEIVRDQLARIENPDRRDRFAFLMPALSSDAGERDRFFASLADVANRRHEPWVLDAIAALHHPLRAPAAERYLRPAIELLEEVQQTGDIFFPKRWLDATLGGHQSPRAAAVVREFLEARPAYPARLRLIILQSADPLFRAAAMGG
jgi:aminopeptidase N